MHKILSIFKLIDRLFSRSTLPKIHRPVLSEQAFNSYFLQKLLNENIAAVDNDTTSDASEYANHIALAFRQKIGDRFFLHPSTVDELCQTANRSYPTWKPQLIESIFKTLNIGLTVYSTQGPRLSKDFPWRLLPMGPGKDSLYPFRPHRFAFLPRLALATFQQLISPNQLLNVIDSWIDEADKGENQFCYGSNLVVIQRILATIWAWLFLAARPAVWNAEGLGLESRLLRILWADAKFLESRIGSSAPNNHLLADRFAAYFLQTVIPEFIEQIDTDAEIKFQAELLRQTYEDGGSFEHSSHYHEFACEMGVAYLLLCRRQSRSPDPQISRRVEALLRFQAALTGPYAKPLAIGNATEDTLFPLDNDEAWCSGALREIYRALYDANVASTPKEDPSIERAFWLLGGKIRKSDNNTGDDFLCQSFPKGGIHVYPDMKLGGRLVFRSGPFLDTPIAAGHVHADLLSVYLSLGGHTILEDAGTYTYRGLPERWAENSPNWRSYFAGPEAHNTLSISGHDPFGRINGDFRNFNLTPRVQCRYSIGSSLAWSEGMLHQADVYTGYIRGCIHVKDCYWIIYDDPPPLRTENQSSWYGFQCVPGSRILTLEPGILQIMNDSVNFTMVTSLPCPPIILEGSLSPLGGWVSPRYGLRLPAPQIRYNLNPFHRHPSAFAITTPSGAIPKSIDVQMTSDGVLIMRLETNNGEDLLILNSDIHGVCAYDDLVFEGQLLWVRLEKKRPVTLRWLNGYRVVWQKHRLFLNFKENIGNMPIL